MSTVVLAILAGLAAFYAGRFAERARTAHQLFVSYRARVSSSLNEWIKDTVLTFLIAVGIVVLVVANVLY